MPEVKEICIREEILKEAIKCVCTDRNAQYGKPEDSFRMIANLWETYLNRPLTAHDVGMMMALLKIARIMTGQTKADNYIDAAGYIACAAQCKVEQNDKRT